MGLSLGLQLVEAAHAPRAAAAGGASASSLLLDGLRALLPVAAPLREHARPHVREQALALCIGIGMLPVPGTTQQRHAAAAVAGAGADGGGDGDGEAAAASAAREADVLWEALQELRSPHVPLRAKGLDTLRGAMLARGAVALAQLPELVGVASRHLDDDDSYVYQAALNALAAAAEVRPEHVLPRLALLVLPRDAAAAAAALVATTAEAAATATEGASAAVRAAERRLKGTQALCQAVLRLGETMPPHAATVMRALLHGARDAHAAVRASSIACLAQVCPTLRLALHPWAVELLELVEATVRSDRDEQAQQAAAHLLAALLSELGADAARLLSGKQLRAVQSQLELLRDRAANPLLVAHADAALDQLRGLYSLLVLGH